MAAIGTAWVDGAWIEAGWASGAWASAGAEISAATTGTAINVPEATIVSTGGTVIITLTNDTFIAAGTGPIGTTAQSQAFIDALSAATSPAGGWNTQVRGNLVPATHLARTSATVATFTIPATAGYAPGATETITPVIQAAILTTSSSDVNSSAFQITVASSGSGALVADTVGDLISDTIQDTIQ